MEPRASLSAFAFAILLGIVALALRGLTHEATALATGFGLYGAVLDLSYIVRRHRRRKLVLGHRRYLDWIVRGQWLSLLVIGTLAAQLLNSNEVRPWSDAAPGVRALVVGWTVLWSVTYASSLVDWYWILPKVSGIVSPPPCTVAGGKTFDRMTGVWLFHRGAATALVTFTLAAVPAWIAGTVNDNDSARTLLTLLSAALAIGFNAANAGTSWALKQFINPQLVVGWYLRVRKDVNDPSPQDAYIVDVSIHGLKYKLESDITGEFRDDGDLMPFTLADPKLKSKRAAPICPSLHECQAANWYCLRNRNAHCDLAPGEYAPAPLPPGVPER